MKETSTAASEKKPLLNLPNKLTLLRMVLVPVCMFVIMAEFIPELWARIIGTAVFVLTSLTDMLDGKIARKYHLITDFGKFLDPVADKLLVIGTMLAVLVRVRTVPVFPIVLSVALFIVIFRELAVTSLRMIVNGNGIVVAAGWPGKIKTVSQMVSIVCMLVEPLILPEGGMILSYITVSFMAFMTLWSGIDYFRQYWKYLDPRK